MAGFSGRYGETARSSLLASLLLLFLLLALPLAQASLTLENNPVLISYDMDYRYRSRPESPFNVTGVVVNPFILQRVDSVQPGSPGACVATFNPATTPITGLNKTHLVHVFFNLSEAQGVIFNSGKECFFVSDLVKAIEVLLGSTNSSMGALILTFPVEQGAGAEYSTQWGNYYILNTELFEIAVAPESTYLSLLNMTKNFTEPVVGTLLSQNGPWNEQRKGLASFVYAIIHSIILLSAFLFACYVLFTIYKTNGCVWPPNMKICIYIAAQMYCLLQFLSIWVPEYPPTATSSLFWFSYSMGYAGYSLLLLTWVRVIQMDRNAKAAINQVMGSVLHVFTYLVIIDFFIIAICNVLGSAIPDSVDAIKAKVGSFYTLPVILIIQAGLFLYYGIRLVRVLRTLTMTKEKLEMIKKMTVLVGVAVVCFLLVAVTAALLLGDTSNIIGTWVVKIIRDFSILCLLGVIFYALQTSKSVKSSQNDSQTSKQNKIMTVKTNASYASINSRSAQSPWGPESPDIIEEGKRPPLLSQKRSQLEISFRMDDDESQRSMMNTAESSPPTARESRSSFIPLAVVVKPSVVGQRSSQPPSAS